MDKNVTAHEGNKDMTNMPKEILTGTRDDSKGMSQVSSPSAAVAFNDNYSPYNFSHRVIILWISVPMGHE